MFEILVKTIYNIHDEIKADRLYRVLQFSVIHLLEWCLNTHGLEYTDKLPEYTRLILSESFLII
jgi:hypothetical protein